MLSSSSIRRFTKLSASVWKQTMSRNFSTEVKEKKSFFRRTLDFLATNKQALINTLGMYFVLSYALYNMDVKKQWGEMQARMEASEKALADQRRLLTDVAWLEATAEKVARSGAEKAAVLSNEVLHILAEAEKTLRGASQNKEQQQQQEEKDGQAPAGVKNSSADRII
eukprot:gene7231-7997_t